MAKDPAAVTAKWVSAMQGSSQAIKDGVNAVTVAPGQAAARQVNAYVSGVANSQDKWKRNVAAVSLQDWQTAMNDKGAARVGTGAAAASGKMQNAMAQLLPAIDQIVANLPARGDLGANINRAVAFMQGMSKVQIRK